MIELLFVTCLIADPGQCTERSLLFEAGSGLQECMLASQAELVRWLEAHPKDQVMQWKCRYAGEGDRAA